MKLTRREALKAGLLGAGGLLSPLIPTSALATPSSGCPAHDRDELASSRSFQPSRQIQPFTLPFKRPPLLSAIARDDLRDYYEIKLQKTRLEILPGYLTEVWTFNGMIPGPLIRQPKRRRSAIRFINELGKDAGNQPIDTSIHLHGMASLPQYDGYAEDLIPPGYYKDYYYPNNRAATLWYHDHAISKTSRNVYMGLAGMYLVDYAADDFQDSADAQRLPQGEYDIPLIIQDKRFASDGSLVFNDLNRRGVYGDVVLVNGVPWPCLEVATRQYRFRVLNGGTSRTLELSLSTGADFWVIASDAGLLNAPVKTKSLRVGVAERYEIIVNFANYAPNTRIYLKNASLGSNIDSDLRSLTVMCFDVKRQETDNTTLPTRLGKVKPVNEILASVGLTLSQVRQNHSRTFRFVRTFSQWLINNRPWNPGDVTADPKLCDFEIWRLVNPGGGWVHPVHIHLVDLRLLSRTPGRVLDYEQGWKDTFYVSENETVEVLARFGPHKGKYMMHCHNLVHEDHDMMTQFEVDTGGCDPCVAKAKPLPAPVQFDPPVCVPQECCCPPCPPNGDLPPCPITPP